LQGHITQPSTGTVGQTVNEINVFLLLNDGLKHFLIRIVGGGVQLGPLGTSATNSPILPAPGDVMMENLVE
jgi:hypothetical protein